MRKTIFGYKISEVNKIIENLREENENLNATIVTLKLHNKNNGNYKNAKYILLEEDLKNYEKDIINFKIEIKELKTQISILTNEIESLNKQNAKLKEQNENLHKENIILKEELAQLANSQVAVTYEGDLL